MKLIYFKYILVYLFFTRDLIPNSNYIKFCSCLFGWCINESAVTSKRRFALRCENDKAKALVIFTMEHDIKRPLVLDAWHLDTWKPRWAIHKGQRSAPSILQGIYRAEDYTGWPLMKAFRQLITLQACQSAALTSVNDLPAHWKQHFSIACCVSHQIQNLFVRFPLHSDAIDANELVSGPQTAFLLCRPLGNDGTNVNLMKLDKSLVLELRQKVDLLINHINTGHE